MRLPGVVSTTRDSARNGAEAREYLERSMAEPAIPPPTTTTSAVMSIAKSFFQNPSHTYPSAGSYTVSLTAGTPGRVYKVVSRVSGSIL
jgi:PKD repeat protein